MTSLVSNDPESGSWKGDSEDVRRVKSESSGNISHGRQVELGKEWINLVGQVDKSTHQCQVLNDVQRRSQCGSLVAVGRDSIEELLDSVVGDDESLTLSELFFIGFSKKLVLLRDTRGGSLSDIRHFGNVLFNNECERVVRLSRRSRNSISYLR